MSTDSTSGTRKLAPRRKVPRATVIDLFCGAGGLTHGFYLEGFRVAAGLDIDSSCRYAFERNNPRAVFLAKALEDVSAAELETYYPDGHTRVLVGCAPCQPFSSAATRKAAGEKWRLVETFLERALALDADVVSMENVLQLKTFGGGEVFSRFVSALEASGYHVHHQRAYGPDFGLPQERRRLILLASRLGPIALRAPRLGKTKPTVWSAIGDLPPISAGQSHPSERLHVASGLEDINLRRLRATPEGGGREAWPEDLVADCHRRESGGRSPSVYGRMAWNQPAPTITTQFHGLGNGRFGHPAQNRALSVLEGALLQGFPRGYEFVPPDRPVQIQAVARHIGNAVPVPFARAIARTIRLHLKEHDDTIRARA